MTKCNALRIVYAQFLLSLLSLLMTEGKTMLDLNGGQSLHKLTGPSKEGLWFSCFQSP